MFRRFALNKKRQELIARLNLKAPLPNGLSVKLAETAPELLEASKLLHNSYVRRQIIKGPLGNMRVSIYSVLPSTAVIVARAGGLLAGTIQIHQRTETNLPIEETFNISSIDNGGRILEIGSLALHDLKAERLEEVYLPLVAYVTRLCTTVLGADRIVIAVQPNTAMFYEALFGFKPFKGGELRKHKFAAGAQAVGLYLEVKEMPMFLAKHYRKLPPGKNLEAYLQSNTELMRTFTFPPYSPPAIHPKAAVVLEEIYVNRSQILSQAPLEWRKNFASLYPDTDEYRWLFKIDTNMTKRTARRHTVSYDVRMTDSFGLVRQGKSVDLSSGGMKIILLEKTLPPSIDEELKIEISPPLEASIHVRAKVRRYDLKEYSLGLQVLDPPKDYLQFVEEVRGTALTASTSTTGSGTNPLANTASGVTLTGSGAANTSNTQSAANVVLSRLSDASTTGSVDVPDKPTSSGPKVRS